MLERWEIPFFCSGIRYANMPTILELAIASICLVIIRIEFHFRLLISLICVIKYSNGIWRFHFQYFQTLPFVRIFHAFCTLFFWHIVYLRCPVCQSTDLGGVIFLVLFYFYLYFIFWMGRSSKSTNGHIRKRRRTKMLLLSEFIRPICADDLKKMRSSTGGKILRYVDEQRKS